VSDTETLNWVQRRARRELILDTQAGDIWNDVRAALQDACNSYNEHYSTAPTSPEVTCNLENGSRIKFARTLPPDNVQRFHAARISLLVSYDKATHAINVTSDETSKSAFRITSDENAAFIEYGGKPQTPDEVSRRILEEFLFSPTAPRRPRSGPSSPAGSSWTA